MSIGLPDSLHSELVSLKKTTGGNRAQDAKKP
jgi:hypothetical protein